MGVGMRKRVVYVALLLEMLLLLNANCNRAVYVEMNSSTRWCSGSMDGDGCLVAELEQDLELLMMEYQVGRLMQSDSDDPVLTASEDPGTTLKCKDGKPYRTCLPGANKKEDNGGQYHRVSGAKPRPPAYASLTTFN